MGYVYSEIREGIYGLPQAGILAQKLPEKRRNAKGYRQSGICPGFGNVTGAVFVLAHASTTFGVKYVDGQHADHLIMNVLKEDHAISRDQEGKNNTSGSP